MVNEALAIFISVSDYGGQAAASAVLSNLFKAQANHEKEAAALIRLESSLAQIGRDGLRASTLDRLGGVYLAQDRHAEAEESYRLAQAIFSSMSDARGEGMELRNLGLLYGRQKQYQESEEHFAQARLVSASIGDDEGEAEALDGIIVASVKQRKFSELRTYCTDACEIYSRTGSPLSEMCVNALELLDLVDSFKASPSAGVEKVE
ncbi:hypothetical protein FRC01_012860 [Tulasnella sp. 417]|nr:hypothetical protein FRC01_012860 [Tulasnella sp. 417]